MPRMLESLKQRSGRRWPRGQRFGVTLPGLEALTAHAEAVRDARAQGRGALEQAQRRWSEARGLEPQDAVVLAELRPGRRSIADVAAALEDCGLARPEVQGAIDRLETHGLAEALPFPSRTDG